MFEEIEAILKSHNSINVPTNNIQKAAIQLMTNDLRFIYSVIKHQNIVKGNYFVALMPYMGVIIDGVEDWVKSYNNSSKHKLSIPVFTSEEQMFYEAMRNAIKLFELDFEGINNLLKKKYQESDKYFSSLCKPLAKLLHIYDIYGVFTCNNIPCNNTILEQCYIPFFEYGKDDKETIKSMAQIGGKFVACFGAIPSYDVNLSFVFDSTDYGGLIKSPFGSNYNRKFLLFSILCQINFVLFAIGDFIVDETTTKLRIAYILYYYLIIIMPKINYHFNSNFQINDNYFLDSFRNAMAHYKLGVALKESEIVYSDPFFGLTQKFFGKDYTTVKTDIYNELKNIKTQIELFLK